MRVRRVLVTGALLAASAAVAPLAHAGGADGLSAHEGLSVLEGLSGHDGPSVREGVPVHDRLSGHDGPPGRGTAQGLLAPGTVVPAAPAGLGGHASVAADAITVDGHGTLGADATVTLSGTYRCLDDGAGPVLVGSNLTQAGHSAGIGGTRAICDGRPHPWTNTGVVKDPAYRPGAARVRATLTQIATGPDGLPVPTIRAVQEAPVTLG
ncbi:MULTISPECIES: DUF6299 family protein [unclassified Streptomyces]|uniref:DUF6299 family protein n=1 Tax=unclassified Streptomyces TaxID=2593676 RepID=UPI00344EA9D4